MMMTPRAKSRERVALNGRHDTITAAHEDHAELIQVARIRTDGGTQMRATLNEETIEDYANLYADGVMLPPLEVTYDGTWYWLTNGFHRLRGWILAHEQIGDDAPPIGCNVTIGDLDDAILKAAGANHDNGLRRTNADKHRAVERLLTHAVHGRLTDGAIADACHVSARMVGDVRKELVKTRKISESTTRIAADGRVINTAKIGTNQPKRKQTPTEIRAQQEPQPQPEPVQPGIVSTPHDETLSAHGYTVVCVGPDRYHWRTPADMGSGPVYPTPAEAAQSALDNIERQEAYERAQRQPEPPALASVQRRNSAIMELEQDCEWFEMTLDRLGDWIERTGRSDIAGDIRNGLRAALDVSRKQLAAHRGETWEGGK